MDGSSGTESRRQAGSSPSFRLLRRGVIPLYPEREERSTGLECESVAQHPRN